MISFIDVLKSYLISSILYTPIIVEGINLDDETSLPIKISNGRNYLRP